MTGLLNQPDPQDTKRLLIALVIVGAALVLWQGLYERPRQHAAQLKHQEETQRQQKMNELLKQQEEARAVADKLTAEQQANAQAKIDIKAPEMVGTIGLKGGGQINYLKLEDYKEEAKPDSPDVVLLQPSGVQAYFIEFGWLVAQGAPAVELPNSDTIWKADAKMLTPEKPVTLSWENGQGLRFENKISLEGAYLFKVQQRVVNTSGATAELVPYGFINRTFEGEASRTLILHEGPLGVMDGSLDETNYKDLIEKGAKDFPNAKGWLGFTDKYWLTALVPQQDEAFNGNFKGYVNDQGLHRYQADFMGKPRAVAAGTTVQYETLVFAGAKKLDMLDGYAEKYSIPLFDRAVDLGSLYFLTKPLLKLLTFLNGISGDFGIALILLTFLVKLAMYPLANKSYISMNEMKRLQPKLAEMKERFGNDKMRMQQEMAALYKKEKINPAAGCLPLFIQIPVFFALYKVLFVTIEMRHANFLNLIHDLSARETSNIFTLFGLIDWNPPSMLHIGILAILMATTMWLQQQMNPKPNDPVQAKMMSFLPWVFMVMLAGFPAGLLLYWVASNTLSILQQWSIKKRYHRRVNKKLAANDA